MIKLIRVESFDELKSAKEMSTSADTNSFAEYEKFMDILKKSLDTNKTEKPKPSKSKKISG